MRLHESGVGTGDAAGKAVARLQPLRAFERWHITSIAITNSSSTRLPSFKMYRGSESLSNFINGTYKGALNADSTVDIWLESGEALVCVWENGDVGSVGTIIVQGTREGR